MVLSKQMVPGLHVFLELSSQFIIFSLTESTLHMLGRNEIQEAIHRTSDPEKFETDLITALSHFIRQTHRTGKCQKYFAFISVWPVSPHMTILQEVVAWLQICITSFRDLCDLIDDEEGG